MDNQREYNNSDTLQQSSSHKGKYVNWLWILVAVCVIAMGLFWLKSFCHTAKKTLIEKPPAASQKQTVSTQPVSELTLEQEASAHLKQEEMKFIEWITAEFPDTDFTLSAISGIYERQGNTAKAIEQWEKLLELNPNRPYVYYGMGKIAKKKEDSNGAISYWRKALELNPKLPRIRIEIGDALMSLGKNAEAIKEIKEELNASPGSPLSQYGYYLLGQAHYNWRIMKKQD